ncbi:MAG: 4Fe-4S ferredoxin [Armatimonadetes bacterium]|nr:MAG: 4Fe-4S ferredoxin [Armatimonadota bacterium]
MPHDPPDGVNPNPPQDPNDVSRAEFLKGVGRSAVLIGLGAAGYATWNRVTSKLARERELTKRPSQGPWYAMAVDIEKCIGCGRCVVACSKENNGPEGHFRTWIERYVITKDGRVLISSPNGGMDGFSDDMPESDIERAFFVPKLCNHCETSPCTQVCPVGATFLTDDGVVLVDYEWCVGCRYCIQACPYGSRFWNRTKRTADKCTMCFHRIQKGLQPACVEVCPTGARIFGDTNDPESPISVFMRENATMTLKPHLRTGAKLAYKGLSKEVV